MFWFINLPKLWLFSFVRELFIWKVLIRKRDILWQWCIDIFYNFNLNWQLIEKLCLVYLFYQMYMIRCSSLFNTKWYWYNLKNIYYKFWQTTRQSNFPFQIFCKQSLFCITCNHNQSVFQVMTSILYKMQKFQI